MKIRFRMFKACRLYYSEHNCSSIQTLDYSSNNDTSIGDHEALHNESEFRFQFAPAP